MLNAKVIGARIETTCKNKVWLLVPKKNLREVYEFKRTYERLDVMFDPTEDLYFLWDRDERGPIEHVLLSFAAQPDLAMLIISAMTGEWFSTWEEVEEEIEYWNERIPIDSES
jgi:hypothetical protein